MGQDGCRRCKMGAEGARWVQKRQERSPKLDHSSLSFDDGADGAEGAQGAGKTKKGTSSQNVAGVAEVWQL